MNTTYIEELLNSHGIKPTPQRMVIAQYLAETDSHPTADEVLFAVSDRLPVKMSRATVYNTLNTLVGAGVIREVFSDPGRTRYDANLSEHHHFVDVKTGKIIDIPKQFVSQLSPQLGKQFKVRDYQITFFGEVANES
jgi:Fe2+ or Zn2+ uptake regulation protein